MNETHFEAVSVETAVKNLCKVQVGKKPVNQTHFEAVSVETAKIEQKKIYTNENSKTFMKNFGDSQRRF